LGHSIRDVMAMNPPGTATASYTTPIRINQRIWRGMLSAPMYIKEEVELLSLFSQSGVNVGEDIGSGRVKVLMSGKCDARLISPF
jgi:hypothetical protein